MKTYWLRLSCLKLGMALKLSNSRPVKGIQFNDRANLRLTFINTSFNINLLNIITIRIKNLNSCPALVHVYVVYVCYFCGNQIKQQSLIFQTKLKDQKA